MPDNGINEKDIVENKYSVGPGIKQAIVWFTIISSFGAGWYTHSQIVKGELASAELTILKQDVINKSENRELKLLDKKALEDSRSKTYDKECGDMSISDFYTK